MRHLFVATDLTQGAARVVARALRLAASTGARVQILHCVSSGTSLEDSVALSRRITTEARLMAEEMIGREIDIAVTISHRRPVEAILEKAATSEADLILLGPHAEPRLRDAIFGTTASHVIRHADRPVLIVQNVEALSYRRVIVALDNPSAAKPVLDGALLVASSAEIFAVHAFDPPPTPFWGISERRRAEALCRQAEIETFLREDAAGRAQALSTFRHALVETGDVAAILMVECFELAPDLLAIGRHHRSPFLGSHAVESLSWCQSDILVVPDCWALPSVQPVAVAKPVT